MLRSALAFLLITQLALAAPEVFAVNLDVAAVVAASQAAVVQVVCYDAEGKVLTRGSGFFADPDGNLVTRRAGIMNSAKAEIITGTGARYQVKGLLADSKEQGLVSLLVDHPSDEPRPVLKCADTKPALGEKVVVLGLSVEAEPIVTEAMVSSVRKVLGRKVVELSGSILPGVWGGAVLNRQGEVIGVVSNANELGRTIIYAIPVAAILAAPATGLQPLSEWSAGNLADAFEHFLVNADSSLKRNHPEDAISYSRKALKIRPDDARAHYYLASALKSAGRKQEASKELEILRKLDGKLAEKLEPAKPAPGTTSTHNTLPELIKKAKPAVIYVWRPLGKQGVKFGSGFFINGEGHFITNFHILGGASKAKVKTVDGKTYEVKRVLAEDRASDLILAQAATEVETPSLQVAGNLPEVGERIVVLGNPKGQQWSAADGIVSATDRFKNGKRFIQISAPISSGSSGGPAINMQCQVVGVNTSTHEGQLLNFASAGQNILDLQKGPGLTLEERAEGWRSEAVDLVEQAKRAAESQERNKAILLFLEAEKVYPELTEPYVWLYGFSRVDGHPDVAKVQMEVLRIIDPKVAEETIKEVQKKEAMAKEKRPKVTPKSKESASE